jgi:hypothetical protein
MAGELAGCFELPFAAMEIHKDGGTPGCILFLLILCLIAGVVSLFQPDPPPPPPPLTERIKNAMPHPINRWKIKRAEKKYKERQEKARKERERQAKLIEKEEPKVEPESWWTKTKDKLRDKLNEDYEERH